MPRKCRISDTNHRRHCSVPANRIGFSGGQASCQSPGDRPPKAPSWRSVSTPSRSASGMMVCVTAEVPSEVSNLRQSIPFRTVNWSQICSRRREDRLKLPSSSALGFFPDSWPRRSGPKMGSASCAFRSSEMGSDSGGCMDVAEIVPWISEVWLSLLHCLQGRRERASAFVFFTTPVYDLKIQLLQPFQPSCQLTLRLSEVAQPGEGSMVCTQQESLTRQIGAVLLCERHHGQQLRTYDAIPSLWHCQ